MKNLACDIAMDLWTAAQKVILLCDCRRGWLLLPHRSAGSDLLRTCCWSSPQAQQQVWEAQERELVTLCVHITLRLLGSGSALVHEIHVIVDPPCSHWLGYIWMNFHSSWLILVLFGQGLSPLSYWTKLTVSWCQLTKARVCFPVPCIVIGSKVFVIQTSLIGVQLQGCIVGQVSAFLHS